MEDPPRLQRHESVASRPLVDLLRVKIHGALWPRARLPELQPCEPVDEPVVAHVPVPHEFLDCDTPRQSVVASEVGLGELCDGVFGVLKVDAVMDRANAPQQEDARVGILSRQVEQAATVQREEPAAARNGQQRYLAFVIDQLAVGRKQIGQHPFHFDTESESKLGVGASKPPRAEFDVETGAEHTATAETLAEVAQSRTTPSLHMDVRRKKRAVANRALARHAARGDAHQGQDNQGKKTVD